jgi:hypothetical protein
MPKEITESRVLVVEGKDEELFFGALISHLGLEGVEIRPIGGKTVTRPQLAALKSDPGFAQVTCLAIVRDADTDPGAAFQSVCDALRAAGLPVPERTLVRAGRDPQVAVMIVPDEDTPGALEDLCLAAVAGDPAMTCVEQYLQCLEKQGIPLSHHEAKGKIHAFLASRPEPDRRLGEAAQKGYWPWDDRAFERARTFLQLVCS